MFDSDIRKISKGITFLTLDLLNPNYVDDFMKKQKAHTYIRAHIRAFDSHHSDNEEKWWIELQSNPRTYGCSFLSFGFQILHSGYFRLT